MACSSSSSLVWLIAVSPAHHGNHAESLFQDSFRFSTRLNSRLFAPKLIKTTIYCYFCHFASSGVGSHFDFEEVHPKSPE
jgi:hypothetical protein